MYVLTVVHGSRNNMSLGIRPVMKNLLCVWPVIT